MRLSDATCDYRHESYGCEWRLLDISPRFLADRELLSSLLLPCWRLLIEIPVVIGNVFDRVRVYILHTCIIYIEKSGTHRHSIGARPLVSVTSRLPRRPLLALLAGTGFGFVKMAEKSGSPAAATAEEQQPQQFLSNFIGEIVKSPVNLALVGLIAILVYKIVKSRTKTEEPVQEVKKLPKLRRDFAIEELTKYDGKGPDGRILVAVNGSVYDVTRGSKFYGPGGPYEAFGGRDASRALARFAVDAATDKYDDLSDLNTTEMNSIKEWEEQFKERYDYVGKLLKPGEAPTNYSDEEDEGSQQETETKSESFETETKTDHSKTEEKSKSD